MSFNIYFGNKLQTLLSDHLINTIKDQPLDDPFQKEIIIVQNQGMTIWLKQLLARELGISCNMEYPFLNGFINRILEETLETPPEKDYFHPYVMTWKIWQLLNDKKLNYSDLSGYLNHDVNGLKHYQLASKIAHCFDQYQIYRPDEILTNLEYLNNYKWQKDIWHEISDRRTNRTEAFAAFQKIENSQYLKDIKRIFIVGIFSMLPMFVEFFQHLAKFIDVHLFFTFPSDFALHQYNYSGKMTNLKIHQNRHVNPFIDTLGKAGIDYIHLLKVAEGNFHNLFTKNEKNSILQIFQSSLQNETITETTLPKENIPSIQLHNCHSRMREVEVLQNNILHLLHNANITPADILVMMPNLADYSPYIKAVFARNDIITNQQNPEIPHTITDNSITFITTIDKVFLKLLGMHKTRFEATIVMDLLEQEAIYKKLQLSADDVELCRKWISETNIRWGLNGEQRENEFGLINFDENSWEKGFNRMFLGYCLKDDDYPKLHFQHLPYDNFEGQNNFILGKLSHFVALLTDLHYEFKEPQTVENWQQKLLQLLDDFFYDFDDFQKDLNIIRQKILKLSEHTQLAEVQDKISIEILQDYFRENLSDEFQTSRYFRGGITFSTLQPIRNIPSKVVCILGMNDNEFPRNEHYNSFNILGNERRCGDRVKREEDQYLFFETILAAEQYLLISYIGQDIKSNDVSEPASPVCELRDYLKKLFGEQIENTICIRHKLQSYNSAYFRQNSQLVSYSKQDFECQIKMMQKEFYQQPLQNTGNIDAINLDDLIRTLSNPSRFFIEDILGAKIKDWDTEISDTELFELDNLEKYSVNQFIQEQLVKGNSKELIYDILKAKDDLPVGLTGKQLFDDYYAEIEKFLDTKIEHFDENLLAILDNAESKDVETSINGIRINGTLPSIYDGSLIYTRFAKFKGKDALKSWLYHLVGIITNHCKITYAFGKDNVYRLPALSVKQAKTELKKIIELYEKAHIKPLPFFPNICFEYQQYDENSSRNKSTKINMAKNKSKGHKNKNTGQYIPGEFEDEYINLFFNEIIIESQEFMKITKSLLSPFDIHNDYHIEKVKS